MISPLLILGRRSASAVVVVAFALALGKRSAAGSAIDGFAEAVNRTFGGLLREPSVRIRLASHPSMVNDLGNHPG